MKGRTKDESNPYRVGKAEPSAERMVPYRPWRGALLGTLLDWTATIVGSAALSLVMGVVLAREAASIPDFEALGAEFAAMATRTPWWELGLLIGGLASVLGGYVCLLVAGSGRWPAIRRMLLLLVITTVPATLLTGQQGGLSWQQQWLGWGVTVVALTAGWWLGHYHNRQRYGENYGRTARRA